jgi:hypothetical protein
MRLGTHLAMDQPFESDEVPGLFNPVDRLVVEAARLRNRTNTLMLIDHRAQPVPLWPLPPLSVLWLPKPIY